MLYAGGLVAFTLPMVNTSSVLLGVNPFSNVPSCYTYFITNMEFRFSSIAFSIECVVYCALCTWVTCI